MYDYLTQSHYWTVAGWTMLHFLWIGGIAGLLAIVGRAALRSSSANTRYVYGLCCLAALAAAPVGIFAYLADTIPVPESRVTEVKEQPEVVMLAEVPLVLDQMSLDPDGISPESPLGEVDPLDERGSMEALALEEPEDTNNQIVPEPVSLSARIDSLISAAVSYGPFIWLIGAPVVFIFLASGLLGAEQLKRSADRITEGTIHDLANRLASTLKVTKSVAIGISKQIASPVLVGIIRPMILLPPIALTGWSAEQIEMALMHELSHVRRWDNLVNLAQRTVEALLFFHPAVWLVSRWVRLEREHCCDAIVLAHGGSPKSYAQMLISLASSAVSDRTAVAMSQNDVIPRVRRILQLQPVAMKYSRMLIGMLAVAVIAISLGAGASANQKAIEEGFEIIIDDEDPSVTWDGEWRTEGSGVLADCHYTFASDDQRSVIYSPTIPVNGLYEVYARWVQMPWNSRNATFEISYRDGVSTLTKDQKRNGGEWILLGKAWFDEGQEAHIKLESGRQDRNPGKYVSTDGIMLKYAGNDSDTSPAFRSDETSKQCIIEADQYRRHCFDLRDAIGLRRKEKETSELEHELNEQVHNIKLYARYYPLESAFYSQVISTTQDLIDRDSSNAIAYYARGIAFLGLWKKELPHSTYLYSEGIASLEKAYQADPLNADYAYTLAAYYASSYNGSIQPEMPEALFQEQFKSYGDQKGKELSKFCLCYGCYLQRYPSRKDEALEWHIKAIMNAGEDQEAKAEALSGLGWYWIRQWRLSVTDINPEGNTVYLHTAIDRFQEAIQVDPGPLRTYLALAKIYYYRGEKNKTLAIIQSRLELLRIYPIKGAGDLRARTEFVELLTIAAKCLVANAKDKSSESEARQHDISRAMNYLDVAEKESIGSTRSILDIKAMAQQLRGDYHESIKSRQQLQRSLEGTVPLERECYSEQAMICNQVLIAKLQFQMKDVESAASTIKELCTGSTEIRNQLKSGHWLLYAQSLVAKKEKEYASALVATEEAEALNPDDLKILRYKAWLLHKLEREGESIEVYNKIVQLGGMLNIEEELFLCVRKVRQLLKEGKEEDARAIAEHGYAKHPSSSSFLLFYASILNDAGQAEQACDILREHLETYPDTAEKDRIKAGLVKYDPNLTRGDKLKELEKLLRTRIEEIQDPHEQALAFAKYFMRKGDSRDYDKADMYLEKAQVLILNDISWNSEASENNNPSVAVEKAANEKLMIILKTRLNIALEREDWEKADQIIAIAKEENIDGVQGKTLIGRKLAKQGEYALAIKNFESVQQNIADDASLLWTLVNCYLQVEEYQKACGVLERIIDLKPNNKDAYRRLAYIAAQTHEEDIFEDCIRRASNRFPDAPWVKDVLAWIAARTELQNEIERLEAIREDNPDDTCNLTNLAFLYSNAGRYEDVQELYSSILEKDNPDDIYALLGLAAHYSRTERYEDARGVYSRILEMNNDNALVLNNYAWLLVEYLQEPNEALPYAEKAVQLKPEGNVRDTLAWVYVKLGRYDEAVQIFSDILIEDPENLVAMIHLAEAYRLKGDSEEANRMLETASNLAELQQDEDAKNKIEELRKLIQDCDSKPE